MVKIDMLDFQLSWGERSIVGTGYVHCTYAHKQQSLCTHNVHA